MCLGHYTLWAAVRFPITARLNPSCSDCDSRDFSKTTQAYPRSFSILELPQSSFIINILLNLPAISIYKISSKQLNNLKLNLNLNLRNNLNFLKRCHFHFSFTLTFKLVHFLGTTFYYHYYFKFQINLT